MCRIRDNTLGTPYDMYLVPGVECFVPYKVLRVGALDSCGETISTDSHHAVLLEGKSRRNEITCMHAHITWVAISTLWFLPTPNINIKLETDAQAWFGSMLTHSSRISLV